MFMYLCVCIYVYLCIYTLTFTSIYYQDDIQVIEDNANTEEVASVKDRYF
jgi:hypothetical protein